MTWLNILIFKVMMKLKMTNTFVVHNYVYFRNNIITTKFLMCLFKNITYLLTYKT